MKLLYPRKSGEKSINLTTSFLSLLFIFCVFFSVVTCRYYALEKKLNPDDADFISKVRYILSEKERRIFLEVPDEEKQAWIEEFWRQRDPNPETEVNELREEYLKRIDEATKMFATEPKPGWTTDRGRIYILYGPPLERISLPMGRGPQGMCGETWYYGEFPISFVDDTCTEQYKLFTYDLSGAQEYHLLSEHPLNPRSLQAGMGKNNFFSFIWRVEKILEQETCVEGTVFIEVPYASIWFSDRDDKLVTTLDLHLELQNSEGDVVWEFKDHYRVGTTVDELKTHSDLQFDIEVPFILTEELESLNNEGNRFIAYIVNQTGGEELRKILEFKINRME